ncbi:MAG TPA: amino acid adenylation domain-containing protein, partial [Tahibacter sp.]|nr:amino acid adenylation domain-containing protein [Tahibacter sp.]
MDIRNGSSAAAAAHDPCRRLRSQLALIVARGGLRPDEPAVRRDGVDWDYATLVDQAQRIAAGLVAQGVKPDAVVALSAERTPLGMAAILAILQVGAAYLPLDTGYPPARLAMMLQDARPDLLLGADEAIAATAPQIPRRTVAQLLAQQAQPPLLGDGALAYVLFTSGSTGRPKGVAMTRRCVGALIDWHRHHPRLGLPARTLQFAPLAFDVSFQEILSTLAVGGTLVLPSDGERRDPHALLALMRRERVERLFLPYVALQALAEAALQEGDVPDSLRDVITAGEALRITPAIRALFANLPQAVLHNHYGPTEAHVVSAHELAGDPQLWPELPPIGSALPHVQMRVVDAQGSTLAAPAEGELLLGGDCLAAGYIHRADLTAQRFVTLDERRWYRTGDRVRVDAHGVFDYLGRCDDQIKLDGYRIEPAARQSPPSSSSPSAGAASVLPSASTTRICTCGSALPIGGS